MAFFSTMLASALPALIQGGMSMVGGQKSAAGIPQPGGEKQQPAMGPQMPEDMGAMTGRALGGFGGRMIGSLANRGMSAMGDKMFAGSDQKAAVRAGQQQKGMMDAAHPGTNPWEQMGQGGANAQASMANTKANNRQADKMQLRDLQNKKEVATITANPGNIQAQQAQLKTPSEIKRNLTQAHNAMAQAANTGSLQRLNEAKSVWQLALDEAKYWSLMTGNPLSGLGKLVSGVLKNAKFARPLGQITFPKNPRRTEVTIRPKRKLTRSGKPRNFDPKEKFHKPGM